MSKIKNGGLDQYGAKPFEQQQFETAGVEGVKVIVTNPFVTTFDCFQCSYDRNRCLGGLED